MKKTQHIVNGDTYKYLLTQLGDTCKQSSYADHLRFAALEEYMAAGIDKNLAAVRADLRHLIK
jgi:hypothetical protein